MKSNQKKINVLKKDTRNANKGTEQGDLLLSSSFKKHGAGRSILVDKDMNVIAGNHALDKAVEAGIEDIIVIPTNGKQLVVVQRTDIDINSREGREMAIADNNTAKQNISFDMDVLGDLQQEFSLDMGELGIDLQDGLGGGPFVFNESDYDEDDATENMETDNSKTDSDADDYEENLFPLSVALNKADKLAWETLKKANKIKSDSELLKYLMRFAKKEDIDFTTFLEMHK